MEVEEQQHTEEHQEGEGEENEVCDMPIVIVFFSYL